MRKLSTETVRFLNHIENRISAAVTTVSDRADLYERNYIAAIHEEKKLFSENETLKKTIEVLESKLSETKINTEYFLGSIKKLLMKLRIDIYSGKTSTPRWFKTGKWWSRETGGFTQEEIETLTKDEILEAFEFYCNTELPFLMKSSMREGVTGFEMAKTLWYKYAALTESERLAISFPQFCGNSRKTFKENLKKEIEYSEKTFYENN
jgi:hypothetical protein